MIRAAQTYAGERRRFGLASRRLYRANREHDALRSQEDNCGIAMLMVGGTVRVVMVGGRTRIMMVMVMCLTLVMIAGARLDIAGERIGEMNVMLGVIDPVHQRDVRLSGQHGSQRHAQNGNRASQRKKASTQQRLALGNPSRRKRWQFSTVEAIGNVRHNFQILNLLDNSDDAIEYFHASAAGRTGERHR
jgi:hypothetical protein